MKELLRVAIMSDLHAFTTADPQRPAPSFLQVNGNHNNPAESPIKSLELLIKTERLSADILLCPGDICDKADSQALEWGWQRIREIGALLKVSQVVGTVGNHDVDSRHGFGVDALAALKQLHAYPTSDRATANQYWARYFTLLDGIGQTGDARIVTLNSSAHHGGVEIEHNHGRVLEQTLRELEDELRQYPRRAVNVLVCHHHPHQHSEILLGAEDFMKCGQQLLDLLDRADLGSWMLIHGHKHHPKITYAAGSSCSPVVLAAGSLAAVLFPQLSTRTRNQFHIASLDVDRCRDHGMSGWVESWSYHWGLGWKRPDGSRSGLPHTAGFGYRGNLRTLAAQVASRATGIMTDWQEILSDVEDLRFVLPQDLASLRSHLLNDHRIFLWEEETVIKRAFRQ